MLYLLPLINYLSLLLSLYHPNLHQLSQRSGIQNTVYAGTSHNSSSINVLGIKTYPTFN